MNNDKKLFLVTRKDELYKDSSHYDQYESFVVCARNEDEAVRYTPLASDWKEYPVSVDSWPVKPEDLETRYIGLAAEDILIGEIVTSSFYSA